MSAPTTAAKVLAAHACVWSGENVLTCQCGQDWRGGTKAGRGAKHAAHQADALREAGLLVETTTEWGIKALFDQGTILPKPADHALDAVRRFPKDWVLVRREVSEWREVQA